VLATVETLVALGFTLWAASEGHWIQLGIAALVTPFLVLRTPESIENGIDWYVRGADRFGVFTALQFPLLWAVVVKVAATVVSCVRNPLRTLKAIPSNWARQVFCIDLAHPPEVVPGIENSLHKDAKKNRFSSILEGLRRADLHGSGKMGDFDRGFVFMIFFPPFAAAFVYRLALKATAIIWLPLLWIAVKLNPSESLKVRLEQINKSSLGHLTVLFALLTITALIAKIMVYNGLFVLSEKLFAGELGKLIFDYIAPTTLPVWQLASATNALIALVLYFWASDQLIKLSDARDPATNSSQDGALRAASALRATLSVYTIACLLYLAIGRAKVLHLPPLGSHLFPWSS